MANGQIFTRTRLARDMEPSDAVGWQKVHTQFKEYESEEGRMKEQSLGFSFKSGGVVRQYPAVLCLVFSPRSHGGLSQEILTSSFSPWSRDRRPASPFFLGIFITKCWQRVPSVCSYDDTFLGLLSQAMISETSSLVDVVMISREVLGDGGS